jgi:tartrate-resistant acid phosphatase type 5
LFMTCSYFLVILFSVFVNFEFLEVSAVKQTGLENFCIEQASPYEPGMALERITIQGDSLKFMVVGDWGMDTDPLNTHSDWDKENMFDTALWMDDWNVENDAHFILGLGDNFYQDGIDSVSHSRWNTTFEFLFNRSLTNLPFYSMLGNHDWVPNGDMFDSNASSDLYDIGTKTEIMYTTADENYLKRWCMPSYYYSFEYEVINEDSQILIQVIVLDTVSMLTYEEGGCATSKSNGKKKSICYGDSVPNFEEQIEWLENTLKESSADWLIVSGHHPIVSVGPHGMISSTCSSGSFGGFDNIRDQVGDLLDKYNVDVYFSGHDHISQVIRRLNSETNSELREFGPGNAGKNDSQVCGGQDELDLNYGGFDPNISYILDYAEKIPGFVGVKIFHDQIQIRFMEDHQLYQFDRKKKQELTFVRVVF